MYPHSKQRSESHVPYKFASLKARFKLQGGWLDQALCSQSIYLQKVLQQLRFNLYSKRQIIQNKSLKIK
jgi:hypothetical protein